MKNAVSKNAWDKFNDPTYGSDNAELDVQAREQMTPDQIWESLCRIDELEGTAP